MEVGSDDEKVQVSKWYCSQFSLQPTQGNGPESRETSRVCGGGDGGLRSGMALSLIYMIALLKEILPLAPPLPIKSKCPKTAVEEGQLTKVK